MTGTGLRQRVGTLTGLPRTSAAVLAGACMALAQAPFGLFFAPFLVLPILFWLWDASVRPGAAFRIGWLAGIGYFALALHWIVEPFLVDLDRHGWMAPFALILMSGGLALFWAVPFAVARGLRRTGSPQWASLILFATLWTLGEYGRSTLLTGFPWALVAHGWIDTPIAQSAALVGPHGLGVLTLLAGTLPALATWRAAVLAVAMVATAWGFGALRLSTPVPEREEPVRVRIVQPNAEQHLKWQPEMQSIFYARLLEATRAPAERRPDITIWPETAVGYVLGYSGDMLGEVAAAAAPDGLVILGLRRLEVVEDAEQWYNSLAVLRPDGVPWAVYDKHHLVPFGEYIPLAGAIAGLGLPRLTTLTSTGFAAGPGPHLVKVPGLPPFLPLICYEAIFPGGMRAAEGRADWLVQVTNDAWFGRVSGPYQHLAQARMRTIEQGVPMARSANTGISAMIGPRGEVLSSLPLGTAGFLDADLPGVLPRPPYARFGDWPVLAALIIVLGLTVLNLSNRFSDRPQR